MLRIKSTSKGGMKFIHEGYGPAKSIDIVVDEPGKSYIKANISNIAFDIANDQFRVTQDTKSGPVRTTLQRALLQNAGKKVPKRIDRHNKFDFRLPALV
jgi:hypothetical protein